MTPLNAVALFPFPEISVKSHHQVVDPLYCSSSPLGLGMSEQLLGVPEHSRHDSTWQVKLHPSLLLVFPSSHCSLDQLCMIPSPQIGAEASTLRLNQKRSNQSAQALSHALTVHVPKGDLL